MKLFLKHITTIALFITLVGGCAVEEFEHTLVEGLSQDVVTVIGRITRFDEYDVATRSVKNEAESKLTSMAMAIFPVKEDGTALSGNCVYWQYTNNQAELLFTVDRGSNYTYNARYAIYVFTNMDMSEFGIGSSLDAMLAKFHNVENIDIPEKGFPMVGSLGDTFSENFDRDNQTFILSPTKDGNLVAPTVNGTTQTLLTIPMKAMFAKINFTIEVTPDQQIEGNYSPQFTLSGYTVNNVPSRVDFSNGSNSDTDVLTESFTLPVTGNTVASGANKINFTFYLPERLLVPSTTWDNYDYPFNKGTYSEQVDKNQNGYRDEDEKYMQRFKPLLVGDSKKATNIVLSGRFRDHQNHYWDVDYTIYLGADNYGDFNILRNSEYNNVITIRGIQSADDMSDKQNAISIDHRVNVERTQPAIISLRREVLLDSHFEVRPLRVRKSNIGNVENINAVKVEVVNPGDADTKTGTWWIRLERNFGDGTPDGSPETTINGTVKSIYINEDPTSPSYGKRRFFTYNLIDGVNANATDATLKNSTSVILPLTNETECCWIYVDECTEVGDAVRAGMIKVSYGKLEGSTFTPANNSNYPDVNYIINQRKLFQVQGVNKYNIEYSEEYLYNFDADNQYGQTEYEGMEWGLEGIQLSYDHEALYFKAKTGDWANGIVDYFTGEVPAYYDFYIKSHDEERMADPKQVVLHEYAGFDFCNEIIQVVNGHGNHDTDPGNNIDVLQLDQIPRSAVEYCYNKNKRNSNGQVAWTGNTDNLKWYLPAVDEIEDIVTSEYGSGQKTYARFLEFQAQDYWSCQPSYIQNYAHLRWTLIFIPIDYWGTFYYDDIGNTDFDKNNNTDRVDVGSARSTSVKYANGKYEPSLSGTNGHYSYYDARTQKYSYEGTFNGVTIGTISREEGNQPRNWKNRIRCVRKMN